MYTYHTVSSAWVGMFENSISSSCLKKRRDCEVVNCCRSLLLAATHAARLTRAVLALQSPDPTSSPARWAGADTLPPAPLELDKLPQWLATLQMLKLFNFKVLHIPFPIMDESTIKLQCFHNYEAVKMHIDSLPFKYYEPFTDTAY